MSRKLGPLAALAMVALIGAGCSKNDGQSEAVGEQLVAGAGGDDLAVADDEALLRVGRSQPSRRPGSKNNLLRNYN
jgi:hypothetical protein